MTIFEKIKNMNQDEATKYIENELCKLYESCEYCPMYGHNFDDNCLSDIFANWLKVEV